jgi:ATP-dependent DNA helicase RecG
MRPDILNALFAPLSSLKGVGPKFERLFTRLLRGAEAAGPARIGDLLFHLPHSLIDRRRMAEIATAPQGLVATLKVRVDRHQSPPRGNRRIPWRVLVHDETGEMALVFFHAAADWIARSLPVGEFRYISGRVESFNGRPSMVHPDYIVSEDAFATLPLLEPVYPAIGGLSQKIIGRAARDALTRIPDLPEWVDGETMRRQGWPDFKASLLAIHKPSRAADPDPAGKARARLAHDEFLAGQLALGLVRERMRRVAGRARIATGRLSGPLRTAFGRALTASQQTAIDEILGDLARPQRMSRLLQGDVGSGKTIVALIAMAAAIEAGGQAAIMAPTEVLARQHWATFLPLCEKAGIRLALLTGREKGGARAATLAALKAGEIDLLVGTHAIFQGGVDFADLGLAVVDEQHRFGVHQRLAFGEKGGGADLLVMTATPIPRTLVLALFGDMDVSRLTEKPAGRQPVRTTSLSLERLDDLVERVGAALAKGRKIYWICPLVEDSEELPATSVEERAAMLSERFGAQVGMVHGRMAAAGKDAAMAAFRDGRTRLLVATTVIEVGVDVPDATIMVIEHAERFGLAQMHQLRGRVGRGSEASSCVLLHAHPLGETARRRIEILRRSDDGFLIAEEDLKLRGQGEVLGARQSGAPGFRLALPELHGDLLQLARDEARLILATDPDLAGPRGPALRALLYLFNQDQAVRLLRAG